MTALLSDANAADRHGAESPCALPSLCCGLMIMALVLGNGSALLNDPDTLWHIEVGRQILASWRFPSVDTMSHTFAGQPWMAKEWLSQVMLALALRIGGWSGVAVLTAACIGLTGALLCQRLMRSMGTTSAFIIAGLAIAMMSVTLLARPHIIAMPVFALWTLALFDRADKAAPPPFWALPLMAVWTNMHASFAIGLVLAGGAALTMLWAATDASRKALAIRWAAFLALASAMTLVTPYGAEVVLLPFRMMGTGNGTEFIQEWRPLAPQGMGLIAMVSAALVLAALAFPLSGRAMLANLPRIAIMIFVTYAMLKHQRFVMLFAVVAPIIAHRQIAEATRAVCLRLGLFQGGDPLAVVSRWPLIALVLAILAMVPLLMMPPAPDPARSPAVALAAARAADLPAGPVYNSYDFGGYLIAQGIQTFVDGRTDQLFLGRFRPELEEALASPDSAAFAAMMERFGVTWAIVQTGSPDARQFRQMQGWRQVHADSDATVFARSTP
jgi:hypothetical protein